MSEVTTAFAFEEYGEPDGINETLTSPLSPDGRPEISKRYILPARQGRAVHLDRGQHLNVTTPTGTQVCDMWAFHLPSLREFLSMEHMRAWLSRIMPKVGDPLVTNKRQTILRLLEDTSPGIHDTLIAACDLARYRSLGVSGYHDNCTDNLRMALKAIGLPTREIPAPLNLWMNVPLQPDGTIKWMAPVSKPMDHLVFQAEMDCVVVLSACPQDLVPINGDACTPQDLQFEVW